MGEGKKDAPFCIIPVVTVKLTVVITKTGAVADIQTISGDPALVPAAITAVKQWRYSPCKLNAEPIKVSQDGDRR